MSTTVPIVDATVVVVPSPDSSKVSIMVVLPTTALQLPATTSPMQQSLQLPATTSPMQQFTLVCGLDTLESHMTLSCKVYQHDNSAMKLLFRLDCFYTYLQIIFTEIFSILFLHVSGKR